MSICDEKRRWILERSGSEVESGSDEFLIRGADRRRRTEDGGGGSVAVIDGVPGGEVRPISEIGRGFGTEIEAGGIDVVGDSFGQAIVQNFKRSIRVYIRCRGRGGEGEFNGVDELVTIGIGIGIADAIGGCPFSKGQ